MDQSGVDEELVKTINSTSEDDQVIRDFLIDLIFEESEHPDRWWWKRAYREKVENCANQWKGNDED